MRLRTCLTALTMMTISGFASASSHREAPAISMDPAADNTDVWAWVSPGTHDKLYVVDTIGDANRAQVVSISKGVASVILPGIGCGYPAGIALAQDESAILVSGLEPTLGTDIVYRLDLGSKEVATVSQGIDTFNESAGLHRAHGTDVYAWADSRANGGGTVFLLSK